MYTCTHTCCILYDFQGDPENVSFIMQFSQKIDGFRQKDSQGFLANSYNAI